MSAYYAPPYLPPCICPIRGPVDEPIAHGPLCPWYDSAHDPAGLASPFASGSPDDPDRAWRWRDGDDDLRDVGIDDPPDSLDCNAGEVW